MRILLVNPDDAGKVEVAIHKRLLSRDFVYPPLGLLFLAGHLRQEMPQHQVRVLDLQTEADPQVALRQALGSWRPEIVGVSVFTNLLRPSLVACRLVKQQLPETTVVVGGPHVDLFAPLVMEFGEVDCAVRGEGERTFAAIVEGLSTGAADLAGIPGLVYRSSGALIETGAGDRVDDLDALARPGRDLVPARRYSMLTGRRSHCTTAVTSRGCPYHCSFCDVTHRKVRFHSTDWVLDDLAQCAAQGIREVHFFDDIFNLRPERVVAIAEGILGRGLRLDWSFRGRVDRMDPAMLAAARRAGCYRVYMGLESGSPTTLEAMRKGFSVEDIRRGVNAARAAGLEVHGYFMIGFPGEPLEDMQMTLDLATELDLDYAQFSVTSYLPGTEIYRDALEQGLVGDFWQEYSRDPSDDFHAPIPARFTIGEREVWELANRAYRQFYLRPRMVARALRSVRSPRALYRRAKGALLSLALPAADS